MPLGEGIVTSGFWHPEVNTMCWWDDAAYFKGNPCKNPHPENQESETEAKRLHSKTTVQKQHNQKVT